MDDQKTNEALRYYGNMSFLNPWDPRDSELIDIIIEQSEDPIGKRLNIDEINDRLRINGFSPLDLINSRKLEARGLLELPYKILERGERTLSDDGYFGDQYNSLATAYGFHRYDSVAYMYLEHKETGERLKLQANPKGNYLLERILWLDDSEFPFTMYNTIEETGVFKEYFMEIQRRAKNEQRRIDDYLNDTRNYGERIGARILDNRIYVYCEIYNYVIPERNEYYLMEFHKGKYILSVYRKSAFMGKYLSNDEYKTHYGIEENEPQEKYESADQLEELINNRSLSNEQKILLKHRRSIYRKMSITIDKCIDGLRSREIFVNNYEHNIDSESFLCTYYGLENEFQCNITEDGSIEIGRNEAEIEMQPGKVVSIAISDLKRAFELGFSNFEDICKVKKIKGNIDAILY